MSSCKRVVLVVGGLESRRSLGRFGGVLAIVSAALLGFAVFATPRAGAKLTPAQSRLVKGLFAIGDSNAARSYRSSLNRALFSANTESVLKTGLRESRSWMTASQRALVTLGVLLDDPANRLLLARVAARKRLTPVQQATLVKLLRRIARNSGVKLLVTDGRALLKSPMILASAVGAQADAASAVPASTSPTDNSALAGFVLSIRRAVTGRDAKSVMDRSTSLLRGTELSAYLKAVTPFAAAAYALFGQASKNADARLMRGRSIVAHPAAAGSFLSPVNPLQPAFPQAYATASEMAAYQLSYLTLSQVLGGVVSQSAKALALSAQGASSTAVAGPGVGAAVVVGALSYYTGRTVGENLARAVDVLVDGQSPPALLVTPVSPPVFYADGSEQFQVQGIVGYQDGTPGQPGQPATNGTFQATLSIGPDGDCQGSICTAITSGPHLVRATLHSLFGTSYGSVQVDVHPGAVHYLDISTEPVPGVTTVQEGVQQDFSVAGRDIHGNSTGADDNAVLSVDPAVGSCPGLGCTFTKTGQQIVTATDGKATGYYVIDVTGSPDTLHLTPQSNTWHVGVANFVAVDEYNSANPPQHVASVAGADLAMTPEGSCPAETCTAHSPGPHTITASYTPEGATKPITGELQITVLAPPDHVTLSPSSATIASGTSQTYTVEGWDAANKDLGPDPDATLTISPDGTCTGDTCTPANPGVHTVTATDGTASDQGELTADGPLDHLKLSPPRWGLVTGASETYAVEGYDVANDDLGPDPNATLTISPNGSCSGYTCTPGASGDHAVTAIDGTATGAADLVATIEITTRTLGATWVGTPYSETLKVAGATPPYTWQIISGSLPSWLTLDPSTGVISGTQPARTPCFDCDTTDAPTFAVTDANGQTAYATLSLLIGSTRQPCACGLGAAPSAGNLVVTFPSYVPTECWVPDTDPNLQYPDGYPMYYFDECYLAIVMLNSDGDYDVVQEYGFADGPGITQVTDQQDPSTIQLPFTPGLSGLEACSPACGGWGEWLELWNAPGNDPAAASLLGISNEITL